MYHTNAVISYFTSRCMHYQRWQIYGNNYIAEELTVKTGAIEVTIYKTDKSRDLVLDLRGAKDL